MRKGFSRETREAVIEMQAGFCKLCLNQVTDIHHKIPNTKTNAKLFPNYLQSIFNAVGLCRQCHENKTNDREITVMLSEALAYEAFLKVNK